MSLMQVSVIEELVAKTVSEIKERTIVAKDAEKAVYDAVKTTMDAVLGEFWQDGYREGKKNTIEQYQAKLQELRQTIANWGAELG